jgi:hypothetical protein
MYLIHLVYLTLILIMYLTILQRCPDYTLLMYLTIFLLVLY